METDNISGCRFLVKKKQNQLNIKINLILKHLLKSIFNHAFTHKRWVTDRGPSSLQMDSKKVQL